MSGAVATPVRVQWPPAAPLAACDFRTSADVSAWLRGQHVRLVHGTWGIVSGLGVRRSDDRRTVIVDPGLAYDRCGREIVLFRAETLQPPRAGLGWMDLTIGAASESCDESAPACVAGTASVARATLRWRFVPLLATAPPPLAAGLRLGDEVPLARLPVTLGGSLGAPWPGFPRYARAAIRPQSGGGNVDAEALWANAGTLAWRATIDTSAARFTTTPVYMVSANRFRHHLGPGVVGPMLQIEGPTASRFDVIVRFAQQPGLPAAQVRPPGGLSWIGVSTARGCPAPGWGWWIPLVIGGLL